VDEAAKVAEADRCTIFLVDRDRGELWSKAAHGAEVIRIPLGAGIAGAVGASGSPIRIEDAYADQRFNPDVDRTSGYRTRTILAVPMRNTRGEVVGVLQALNRKDGAFTAEDEELLGALAGPAASAVENAVLNEEIERLFEGFVQASLFDVVVAANRPTVLPAEASARLEVAAARTFVDARGEARPLLTPLELSCLSIPKGSLSAAERSEIEGHVAHTFRFLSEIPWTRTLRRVPEIAYGHHEKLDGHGYPRGVPGKEIAVETRMMTISDIYDALTASDRPYKKAMPPERALEILQEEARHGKLDAPLLGVFVEAGIWR
jgi:signal transduction protein with GAF and PtsI domain